MTIFNFPLSENFNPVVCENSKVNYLGFLVGFTYNNHVWSAMLNYMVPLNVKVSENFKRLTFCTRKRFVFVPYLVNFKAFISTNIPVQRLSHPAMSSFAFFLKKFIHYIFFLSLNDHSVTSSMVLIKQYLLYISWTDHGVFYSSNLIFFWFAIFFLDIFANFVTSCSPGDLHAAEMSLPDCSGHSGEPLLLHALHIPVCW